MCNAVRVISVAFVIVLLAGCPTTPPSNQPPTADAGPDQAAAGGTVVTLDASGSQDADGGAVQFSWTQSAGPTAGLTDANTANPTLRAPNQTVTLRYVVEVTDDGGLTDTDSVTIQVTFADNVPPIASAGLDRTVQGGTVVELDGTGSIDADGDPLSYAWTQTDGTSVGLSDSDTPAPSFAAPNMDDTLTFELTIDDGNNHTDTDSVVITIVREPTRLFVTNLSGNSLLRFTEPAANSGNVAPDATLSGAESLLNGPADSIVATGNWLIVANSNSNALNVYVASALGSGQTAPSQIVAGPATMLDQPTAMAYDRDADVLFVSNTGGNSSIVVFPGPGQVIFNGNLEPLGVISHSSLSLPAGIALDGQDRLYVANTGGTNVLVFEDASTLDGTVAPTRTITSSAFDDVVDVFIDPSDRLYVLNSTGTLLSFDAASTLSGDESPSSTLTVSGSRRLFGISVDRVDTGYILDTQANAIYMFDNLATRSGIQTPDRTIAGDETMLDGPFAISIFDQ